MKQPIAGVSPPEVGETTIMTVWPSIAATGIGRRLGALYSIDSARTVFAIGNLIALLSIPLVIPIFFWMLVPGIGRCYRLTNRRIVIETIVTRRPLLWVSLDKFDTIDIEVLDGQGWYPAGDLVFREGATERLRISGVPRPETFRQTCLKARNGYAGARQAVAQAGTA